MLYIFKHYSASYAIGSTDVDRCGGIRACIYCKEIFLE